MSYFLIFICAFILGLIFAPFAIFLRARKCKQWDKSNMMNILRVLAHLATHPDDFAKFRYENGLKPFWYLGSDEFLDIVKTRAKE
ncbi:hypothetical protein KDE13_00020 [Campylobacter sp. faydin G-140]|uniref:hypothetical protein n=1 Tax=Campylobacter anatolicus TaxID=2829105 RepID=UPI001BA33C52|nr:hypothetical protein [Campylobacter anatolicus]MBR8464745.1 hypothetical protein [Campylobacter anatolicus]